ncbi:MAG: DUF460 domain-containing protein [Candidatus Micrarchaeia archaeon]
MHIIAGVDPGATIGVSCISLDGELVLAAHGSGKGIMWVVETIRSAGTPSLIASDKHKVGSLVKKVGAIFSTRVFYPERDISLEEKKEFARASNIKNPHERDALAAAIFAFNEYKNKLKQAERIALENNYENVDEIKAKVLSRYSIDEALHNKRANRK